MKAGFLETTEPDGSLSKSSKRLMGTMAMGMIAFSLPYGDSVDWPVRIIVALAYPLSTSMLGVSVWQPILVFFWILLFWLSRNEFTQKAVPWKIWEGTVGFLYGISVAHLLTN